MSATRVHKQDLGADVANPMATPADLIVGGTAGAPARLSKGAGGYVLTVDPTTHLIVWALAPGAGGGASVGSATPLVESGSGAVGTSADSSHEDHVHPSGGGGGGGGFPLDAVPGSPSAWDDEFTGSSLDGKWTNPTTSASGCDNTITVAGGWMLLQPGSSGGKHSYGIRQAAPASTFTMMAKILDKGPNEKSRIR